jgi:hypothetical protein
MTFHLILVHLGSSVDVDVIDIPILGWTIVRVWLRTVLPSFFQLLLIFRFGHQGLLVTAGCDLLTGLLLLISSLLFCRSADPSDSAVMTMLSSPTAAVGLSCQSTTCQGFVCLRLMTLLHFLSCCRSCDLLFYPSYSYLSAIQGPCRLFMTYKSVLLFPQLLLVTWLAVLSQLQLPVRFPGAGLSSVYD